MESDSRQVQTELSLYLGLPIPFDTLSSGSRRLIGPYQHKRPGLASRSDFNQREYQWNVAFHYRFQSDTIRPASGVNILSIEFGRSRCVPLALHQFIASAHDACLTKMRPSYSRNCRANPDD
ncbi:MAG: hypothetical protein CL912_18680 [Deltaproteobacteria bacterium]|nr:hypothetical protein [Deltaproteobacteria bacterium]